MREILFRGKRIDINEWIEGYYAVSPTDSKSYIYAKDYTEVDIAEDGLHVAYRLIQVFPATVGQYTGLTDKNGTRVFEGDILKIINKYQSPFDDDTNEYTDITTDVVHFDDEGLCFSYGKSPFLCVADNVTAEYEVVGNIYDDNLEELANGR